MLIVDASSVRKNRREQSFATKSRDLLIFIIIDALHKHATVAVATVCFIL